LVVGNEILHQNALREKGFVLLGYSGIFSRSKLLLQKSKLEQPQKSRESWSLDFSAAALLFIATTETRGRFWMKRYGPSHRRT